MCVIVIKGICHFDLKQMVSRCTKQSFSLCVVAKLATGWILTSSDLQICLNQSLEFENIHESDVDLHHLSDIRLWK